MVVGDVALAVQICAQGELLALLPDPLARSWAGEGMLRRLPLEVAPPRGIYAVHRELPGPQGPTAALVDLARAMLRQL